MAETADLLWHDLSCHLKWAIKLPIQISPFPIFYNDWFDKIISWRKKGKKTHQCYPCKIMNFLVVEVGGL
jgi:hypothetical protein